MVVGGVYQGGSAELKHIDKRVKPNLAAQQTAQTAK